MTDNMELGGEAPLVTDERAELKERLTQMGISFQPNAKTVKLRTLLENALAGDVEEEEAEEEQAPVAETFQQKRHRLRKEALKLVRIRVTCMNPLKSELKGEIYTLSNSLVGTIKKYVPYNGEPYHVPHMLYQHLRDSEFQGFVTKKLKRGETREGRMIKEFAIEVLPDLTQQELKELGRRQAMAKAEGEVE